MALGSKTTTDKKRPTLIWDIPTRVFHWLLVLAVSVCLYTGFFGDFEAIDYHMLSGYGVLTLLLFRFAWGLTSKGNARFSTFTPQPSSVLAYIKGIHPPAHNSHNPLGALSVFAMLILLLLQAGTGLFANDDIFTEGPLSHLVSYETSLQLTSIHSINRWLLVGLLATHIVAILFYDLFKKQRLSIAMISGSRVVAEKTAEEKSMQQMSSEQITNESKASVNIVVEKTNIEASIAGESNASTPPRQQLLLASILFAVSGLLVYGLVTYI